MTTFKYFELIAFFYAGIFEQIKQGIAFDMAVNISFDNLWLFPEHENRLSNLILQTQYLNVKYAMHKSFTPKQIEVYKNQLELVNNEDLVFWLNPDELEHLNETIYNLDSEIDIFLQNDPFSPNK
jgi:hypothetical protein